MGFDTSYMYKLSPFETICMECQNPFSWKNKKKQRAFKYFHQLKMLPRMLSRRSVIDIIDAACLSHESIVPYTSKTNIVFSHKMFSKLIIGINTIIKGGI